MLTLKWCVLKGNQVRSVYHQSMGRCTTLIMSDARILKVTVAFVFILGITSSIFISLFLDYIKKSSGSDSNTKVRVFTPYPFDHSIGVPVEEHEHSKEKLELTLRKADIELSGEYHISLSNMIYKSIFYARTGLAK